MEVNGLLISMKLIGNIFTATEEIGNNMSFMEHNGGTRHFSLFFYLERTFFVVFFLDALGDDDDDFFFFSSLCCFLSRLLLRLSVLDLDLDFLVFLLFFLLSFEGAVTFIVCDERLVGAGYTKKQQRKRYRLGRRGGRKKGREVEQTKEKRLLLITAVTKSDGQKQQAPRPYLYC